MRERRLWVTGRFIAPAIAAVAVLSGSGPLHGQSGPATAGDEWTPGPELSARVRETVAARWGVDATRVRLDWGAVRDPRALPSDAPFRFIGNGAGGTWVVAFEPDGAAALRVRLRAGVEAEQPVAARDMERDHVLSAADIERQDVVTWGPPEPPTAVAPGWVARRRIAAGQPLAEPAVSAPDVIEAGTSVQVEWRRGPVVLTLPGRALGSAARGERIQVRTDSGQRLEGVAAGPGLIQIEAMSGRMQ